MGQIEESAGDVEKAAKWYQSARTAAESLRDMLRNEELKIAFMKNKLEVYESLVRLCLDHADQGCDARDILDCMEEAKSRSLRDLMGGGPPERETGGTETAAAGRMRELREELNWYYHRIELEQLGQEPSYQDRVDGLQAAARDREKALVRLLRDTPPSEAADAGISHAPAMTIEAIRAALGPDTVLVEYFYARDQLVAAVLSQEVLEVRPISSRSQVDPLIRLLQFQLSKFRLGANYAGVFRDPMLRAATAHLRELYETLLAPVRRHLHGRHVVFVPHENLHHLPMHALFDGSQYMIDAFTVSYAPSAGIYALCRRRQVNTGGASLDSRRPRCAGAADRRGSRGGCRNPSPVRTVPGRRRQPADSEGKRPVEPRDPPRHARTISRRQSHVLGDSIGRRLPYPIRPEPVPSARGTGDPERVQHRIERGGEGRRIARAGAGAAACRREIAACSPCGMFTIAAPRS